MKCCSDRPLRKLISDWPGAISGGLFVLLTVVPVLLAFSYALLYSVELVGLLSKGFTSIHWQTVLHNREVAHSFLFSLTMAVLTVVLSSTAALAITLSGHRFLRGAEFSRLLLLPLLLAPTVAAFIAVELFSGAGLLARLAFFAGWIDDSSGFPSPVRTSWGAGILLVELLLAIPFLTVYLLKIFAQERIETLLHVAYSLGASPWQAALKVGLPQMLNKAGGMLMLYGIFVFGAFEVPKLLGPQHPEMISLLVQRKFAGFDLLQKPQAFVIASLYSGLTLTVLALVLFRRRRVWYV